jgi:hypothetical protein
MTTEDKELLLKDLSARLPYEVKYMDILNPDEHPSTLQSIDNCGLVMANDGFSHEIENVKPYLFPLESMSEEQKNYIDNLWVVNEYYGTFSLSGDMSGTVDFYNKHHLDWRGLIPMGLALDATNLNIY